MVASMAMVPECIAKKDMKQVIMSVDRNVHAYF